MSALLRYGPFVATLLVSWPLWPSFFRRTFAIGEPWGLVALVGAAWVVARRVREHRAAPWHPSASALAIATLAVGGYALLWNRIPYLLLGVLVALAAAATLLHAIVPAARARSTGLAVLALLALPVGQTADLFLGYPLRVVSAALATGWLDAIPGLDVTRLGTGFEIGGRALFVDPACAGMRMLWTAAGLGAVLTTVHGARASGVIAGTALTALAAIPVNAWRTAALAFVEWSSPGSLGTWQHGTIGVLAFAVLALAASRLLPRFAGAGAPPWEPSERREAEAAGRATRSDGDGRVDHARARVTATHARSTIHRPRVEHAEPAEPCGDARRALRPSPGTGKAQHGDSRPPLATWALVAVVPIAALLPLVAPVHVASAAPAADEVAFPGWPTSWEGEPLIEVPLDGDELEFERLLPGRSARFRVGDGGDELVLRWIERPSRKVHTTRHCFRGAGFTSETRDAWLDGAGRAWTRFAASRPDVPAVEVRELLVEPATGAHWPDPGAWYWSAGVTRTSTGPWWSITWILRAPHDSPAGGDPGR